MRPPKEIILDFDATGDGVHGNQEGRFSHGYYDHYCFLPLYVFCGSQLLCAYLWPSKIDEFNYAAATWDRERRVIIKAEHTSLGAQTPVSSLLPWKAILRSSTTKSTALAVTWKTGSKNSSSTCMPIEPVATTGGRISFASWLSSFAYVLFDHIRRTALKNTRMAHATSATIRNKRSASEPSSFAILDVYAST